MAAEQRQAQKILARVKGLGQHLEEQETPILTLPGIWDGGQTPHSETCEVIITNLRIIGYYYRSFPREKLFLDALPLSEITSIEHQTRNYSPVFRELKLQAGKRTVYIRTPQRQMTELSSLLEQETGLRAQTASEKSREATSPRSTTTTKQETSATTEEVKNRRIPFEETPFGITLLFAGGIILEVLGVWIWANTGSAATGFPLCMAGFIAVAAAMFVRWQQRKKQPR